MSKAKVTPLIKKRAGLLRGLVFDLERLELELDGGKRVQRDIIRHPGAVVILPQAADGRLILVRQWRAAVETRLLEFPAGTLEAGEVPLVCAQRELAEEADCQAAKWQELGILYPAPGICDEKQYCYFASELSEHSLPGDEDEDIEVERLTVAEVEAAISSGAINDAKSSAIFLRGRLAGFLA